MQHFLGIDIGGTNVKFGIVSEKGELLEKTKFKTADVADNGNFLKNFKGHLADQLANHPEINKIGIGVPGTISLDRNTLMELSNIPSLNGVKLLPELKKAFPTKSFYLENDANAAALGEYYFGTHEDMPESYFFITLGTGVGGAAILNKQIFKGGDGNGMEIGHIPAGDGRSIEDHLGKKGIVKLAKVLLKRYPEKDSRLRKNSDLDSKYVAKSAHKGDEIAIEVYKTLGTKLGETMAAGVRILDIKTILIGGGVSETFGYMTDNMNAALKTHLTDYYLSDLRIHLASLKNEAGIIGAASLCFID